MDSVLYGRDARAVAEEFGLSEGNVFVLAGGGMCPVLDERDALVIVEEFGLGRGGVFVLAGGTCEFEKVDEVAFGDDAIFVLVSEREMAEGSIFVLAGETCVL